MWPGTPVGYVYFLIWQVFSVGLSRQGFARWLLLPVLSIFLSVLWTLVFLARLNLLSFESSIVPFMAD